VQIHTANRKEQSKKKVSKYEEKLRHFQTLQRYKHHIKQKHEKRINSNDKTIEELRCAGKISNYTIKFDK
jgi:hypothetical protein